nr:TraA family conjugative transfer protein [uncultured Halomonas sp.]
MGTLQQTLAQRLGWAARMRGGQMANALSGNRTMLFTLGMAMALVFAGDAMAGTGESAGATADEDTFGTVYTTLKNWTQGTLGRVISLTLIVVGACMGVVRQSLMTFVVGIAMGLALYNAPLIIEKVMTGSIEAMVHTEGVVSGLSNGML